KHTEKVLKAWCLKIPNLKAQLSAGKEFCLMFGVIVSTTDSCPRHRFIDELAGREDRTPSYGNKLGPCLVLE
ncbi:MAG: hypothetical protein KAJ14_15215, partial [Candidatus Omnitrophica bacterium]|nr:hypothetical protein [Candidatus Omnitrophota bacterium]